MHHRRNYGHGRVGETGQRHVDAQRRQLLFRRNDGHCRHAGRDQFAFDCRWHQSYRRHRGNLGFRPLGYGQSDCGFSCTRRRHPPLRPRPLRVRRDAAAHRSLPFHCLRPSEVLPPKARKLERLPALTAKPSSSKSSAVSVTALAALPPAAADAVLAAGISLPIPYAMDFWPSRPRGRQVPGFHALWNEFRTPPSLTPMAVQRG